MQLDLLVSPLAKTAYFGDVREVARAELLAHLPGARVEFGEEGTLLFLRLGLDDDPRGALPRAALFERLLRLSFVQAVFEEIGDGGLRHLVATPEYRYAEELVIGSKYAGKTNETVTQLALNLALCHQQGDPPTWLFDPMAGRGTTLLWALRYGLNALGIELEVRALDGFQQHLKKQTHLQRLKHRQSHGTVKARANQGSSRTRGGSSEGKRSRDRSTGRFVQFDMLDGPTAKLICGDSRHAEELVEKQRFPLLVTDLPYGIQHMTAGRRNPLEELRGCIPAWAERLRPGGSMVLIFNTYQPRRDDLVALLSEAGLDIAPFSAPHRMSESIVRDLVVAKRPL